MAKGYEVLDMLCPNVGRVISGDEYENINWLGETPAITKKQFQDGFAKYDALKLEQDEAKANAKAALLDRLGITAEEAQLLLS
jgi:hypothetical protein